MKSRDWLGETAGQGHDAATAPVISVSMDQGRIVLRPIGHLDEEAIDTLRDLLAGARAAGAVAVVDLAQIERPDLAEV